MHEEEHCTKNENCASVLILQQIKVWICNVASLFIFIFVTDQSRNSFTYALFRFGKFWLALVTAVAL